MAAEARVAQRLIRENLKKQLVAAHTAAEAGVTQRLIRENLQF